MKLKDELANVQAVFSENLDRIKEYAPQLKASGRYKVFENRLAWDCLKAFVGVSLAIDAKTTKLKYGHRGVNHPVKDIDADRTYITSQNHGYAVVGESVDPKIARVRYVNLNDGTVEGLEHIGRPVFTVQYHPEVCPGPMDTSYLFDKFIENIEKSKGGAQ